MAVGAIAWEAVQRLIDPQPVVAGIVMLVAGVGILINGAKGRMGLAIANVATSELAIVAAGFQPAEADQLRRAMATFKRVGTIH